MQLVQAHGPRADLAEGGVGLRECDMLRVLHAVLAFDKGYQSEGLQLLAWHIGARNARRGRGSREISQEDSRENSSLSKCHCSVVAGFIGIAEGKVEMLFIHPDYREQGIGRTLLSYAIHERGATTVDVNEQNDQALGFYIRMGFEIIGRSELDSNGKPYPLLHMRLASVNGKR